MKETLETQAMRWWRDRMKTKNGTKKELHVLNKKRKEEHELHRQVNELQQEQEQQGAQHALTDETVPRQVKYPSQQLTRSRHGEKCGWLHVMDSTTCMSLCARMKSNPFKTLTKAKTRSKSDWSWMGTSASWCAWPPTHTWRSAQTLYIDVLPVQPHLRRPCAC